MVSCVGETEFKNTRNGNFEALWKVMDEHYCFFTEKKATLGVDWDEVHTRYGSQVTNDMTNAQLFELSARMLSELKDGHVNLSSSWDFAREWSWNENYPANFSDSLHRKYLGTDYRIAGSIRYRILEDNIGYIYIPSFASAMGEGNLDNVMYYLAPCNGLIIDIRENGGGMITSAETLARRFTNEPITVGYMQHKTGKGHDDFSERKEQRLQPSNGMRWQKSVCVITNRKVYSAANEFTKYMKAIGRANGRVTIIGDKTGGGGGMPFTSELPNGWIVRFSACPMYDELGHSVEQGIAPDHSIGLADEDFGRGEDTLIEYARKLLAGK